MADSSTVVEDGLFRGESLYVRFAFPYAEFVSAVQQYMQDGRRGPLSECLRTYVHELTHSIQYAATPYGMFLHYCRWVQTSATIALVKALWRQGLEPSLPLLRKLRPVGGEAGVEMLRWHSIWFNVESLLAHLSEDPDKKAALFRLSEEGGPVCPPLLLFNEAFTGIQEQIALLVERENSLRGAQGLPEWDQAGFDHAAIQGVLSALPSDRDKAVERTEDALNLLGNPWGVSAIIESAATASEFTRSGIDLAELRAWLNQPHDPSLEVYRSCLLRALDSIKANDLPQFLFSYLALCEFALFAPLLPQHAGLRGVSFPMEQLYPVTRFNRLLEAAGKVAPMRGIRDHARYVTDLCRSLDWVHPMQIVVATMNGPRRVSDPRAQVYVNAQFERGPAFWSFLDVAGIALDGTPWASELRQNCTFVVTEHTDKTLYHRDKDYLEAMTNQHLMMLAMRYVMLGSNLRIPRPYRCEATERSALTVMLRANLQMCFGRQFPMAEVI